MKKIPAGEFIPCFFVFQKQFLFTIYYSKFILHADDYIDPHPDTYTNTHAQQNTFADQHTSGISYTAAQQRPRKNGRIM